MAFFKLVEEKGGIPPTGVMLAAGGALGAALGPAWNGNLNAQLVYALV